MGLNSEPLNLKIWGQFKIFLMYELKSNKKKVLNL
jgi:hypothetical protein